MPKQQQRNISGHAASDHFIQWAESLSGFVAFINVEYGGVSEMVEHHNWDASRNKYLLSLLNGLKRDVAQLSKELKGHVNGCEKIG
jgi:hypothetical protein